MIARRVIATPSMHSNANTDTTATFLLLFIHDTVNIEVLSKTTIAITVVTTLTDVTIDMDSHWLRNLRSLYMSP